MRLSQCLSLVDLSGIDIKFIYCVQAKAAYSQALYDSVCEQYKVLHSAVNGGKGLEASTPSVSLSQPLQFLD